MFIIVLRLSITGTQIIFSLACFLTNKTAVFHLKMATLITNYFVIFSSPLYCTTKILHIL